MEIIEYFTNENKSHWLSELKKSEWEAGQLLYELITTDKFKDFCGEPSSVYLLNDGDKIVSFCTYAARDDVPTDLSPWIGFVYTFPQYRGHKYIQRLISHIESLAFSEKKEYIYISTFADGLYEHYGYEFYRLMKDIHGEDTRVYRKKLS